MKIFGALFGVRVLCARNSLPIDLAEAPSSISDKGRAFAALLALVALLSCVSITAQAGAPAMLVPGQFNVSNTGAFTYTIPIVVPPGTAGMVPALSLDYSSQNASDGLEGWGWTLSGLPSITRCPMTIAQDNGVHGGVNYDSNDRFCLEGQRLIPVNTQSGQIEYRTEIDGFSKIVAYIGSYGPTYFKVWTKAGQIMEFGHTADSAGVIIQANCSFPLGGSGGPCPTATNATSAVRVWAVDRIWDTKGNYLSVTYDNGTSDTTNGQLYPTEIDYTGNSNTGTQPYNSVQFVYSSSRPDVTTAYQAGAQVISNQLLTDIVTYNGGAVVHDYRLCYSSCAAGSSPATPSATSPEQLLSVTLCDGTGSSANCLAPTSFAWQGGAVQTPAQIPYTLHGAVASVNKSNNSADFDGDGLTDSMELFPTAATCGGNPQSVNLGALNGQSFSSSNMTTSYSTTTPLNCNGTTSFYVSSGTGTQPQAEILDIDGDGFPDVLVRQYDEGGGGWSNNWYLLQNNGQGSGAGQFTQVFLGNLGDSSLPVIGDFNGDGLSDYFIKNGTFWFSGGVTTGGAWQYTQAASANNSGSPTTGALNYVYAGDFDGDGCTDLLSMGNANKVFYSCQPAIATAPDAVTGQSYMVEAGYAPTFGDFNGDGKTDILWTKKGEHFVLWLATGTGFYQQTLAIALDGNNHTVVSGDWNGDGKADVADVDAGGTITLYLSTGSNFVSAAQYSFDNTGGNASAYEADWNSDGGPDLWLQFASDAGDELVEFSYTPIGITSVQNGIGATTNVTYDRLNDPSNNVYTKCPSNPSSYDCGLSYPNQAVNGPLYVVQQIASSNGINTGNYTSTYSYAGGVTNLQGRGFQGFSQMKVTDSQTGIVQTTSYRTSFPYTGMVSSQTKVCPADTTHCQATVTLSKTENTYESLTLGSGSSARYYVQLTKSVVTSAELDGSKGPLVTTLYQSDCDAASSLTGTNPCFGDMQSVDLQTADSHGTLQFEKTTTSTFTDDATNWFLGRLKTANVASTVAGTTLTRKTSYAYDPSSGLLTQEIVSPTASSGDYAVDTLETDTNYDAYGNKTTVSVVGCLIPNADTTCGTMQTRTTTMLYDTTHHQFLVKTTNAIGESETWGPTNGSGYNAFGEATIHTGPNGLPTNWVYDTFGRAKSETPPDQTISQTFYFYCSGVNGGTVACAPNASSMVETKVFGTDGTTQIGPIARVYYDSLSRAIGKDVQGFNGCWIRQDTIYDGKGRLSKTDRPYFIGNGGSCPTQTPAYTTYSYTITGSIQDALGRVQTMTVPGGHGNTSYAYTNNTSTAPGSVEGPNETVTVTIKDRPNTAGTIATVNEVTTTQKNYLGLVTSVIDAAGSETDYTYDPFDNLATITTPGNATNPGTPIVTTYSYDIRGRKVKSIDPDMGTWTYAYDSWGELYQQTDPVDRAAGNAPVTMSYDSLGRMISRVEPDMTSTWLYGATINQGTYPNSIDKLVVESCTTGTVCDHSFSRTYTYDSLGRQKTLTWAMGTSATHNTVITYDPVSGKQATVQAFSGFTIDYNYNATGYMKSITDDTTGSLYWQANAEDAELHLTQQTAGNGVVTNQVFDPNLGFLESIASNSSGSSSSDIADFSYNWDMIGTLTGRTDMLTGSGGQSENFCYDSLNRLKYSAIQAGTDSTCIATGHISAFYDAVGNITSKTTVGGYNYGEGSAGPHAVTSVSGTVDGIASPTYTYDANGNMLCALSGSETCTAASAARFVTYTSFNKTLTATQGTTSLQFYYDDTHERIYETQTVGGVASNTEYVNDPVANVMNERVSTGGVFTWKNYIRVGGRIVALRSTINGQSGADLKYFVTDQIGSIAVVTDGNSADPNYGKLITTGGRQYYDAWGKMRNADGSADTTCANPSSAQSNTGTTRGFTSQEQIPALCLVNYNARLYDPTLGRFMAPDPTTEAVYNLQDLNRYSYVLNNPLSLNDPTGYGGFFGKGGLGLALVGIAAAALMEFEVLPVLEGFSAGLGAGSLAATATSQAAIASGEAAQAATLLAVNAGISGGISGAITSGTLKGAMMGGLEAEAFFQVGSALQGDTGLVFGSPTVDRALAHGMVGGLFSIGQKGGFGSGFLAAGMGSVADDVHVGPVGDTVVHAVAGGVGSILGGGKFANGAITGAFGYLFNHELHMQLTGDQGTLLICDTCNPKGMAWEVFSGNGECTDNPACVGVGNSGPIPQGQYYIVQHGVGGVLGQIWDFLRPFAHYSSQSTWFELWSTKTNSDQLTVDGVTRENFRLHPVGPMGLSEGCVTVCSGFSSLREQLLSTPMGKVPGTDREYYGILTVK